MRIFIENTRAAALLAAVVCILGSSLAEKMEDANKSKSECDLDFLRTFVRENCKRKRPPLDESATSMLAAELSAMRRCRQLSQIVCRRANVIYYAITLKNENICFPDHLARFRADVAYVSDICRFVM